MVVQTYEYEGALQEPLSNKYLERKTLSQEQAKPSDFIFKKVKEHFPSKSVLESNDNTQHRTNVCV